MHKHLHKGFKFRLRSPAATHLHPGVTQAQPPQPPFDSVADNQAGAMRDGPNATLGRLLPFKWVGRGGVDKGPWPRRMEGRQYTARPRHTTARHAHNVYTIKHTKHQRATNTHAYKLASWTQTRGEGGHRRQAPAPAPAQPLTPSPARPYAPLATPPPVGARAGLVRGRTGRCPAAVPGPQGRVAGTGWTPCCCSG